MTIDEELRSAINDFADQIEPTPGSIDAIQRRLGRPDHRRWLLPALAAAVIAVALGVVATRPDEPEHVTATPAAGTRQPAPLVPKRLYKQYDEVFHHNHGPMYLIAESTPSEGALRGKVVRVVVTPRNDGQLWFAYTIERKDFLDVRALRPDPLHPLSATYWNTGAIYGASSALAVQASWRQVRQLDRRKTARFWSLPGRPEGVFADTTGPSEPLTSSIVALDSSGLVVGNGADPTGGNPSLHPTCEPRCSLPKTSTVEPRSTPADGVYPGRIASVDLQRRTIGVNFVQWLQGSALRGRRTRFGYAIKDRDRRVITLAVASEAPVVDCCLFYPHEFPTEQPAVLQETVGLSHSRHNLDALEAASLLPDNRLNFNRTVFWVTVRGGVVTKIEEQWESRS